MKVAPEKMAAGAMLEILCFLEHSSFKKNDYIWWIRSHNRALRVLAECFYALLQVWRVGRAGAETCEWPHCGGGAASEDGQSQTVAFVPRQSRTVYEYNTPLPHSSARLIRTVRPYISQQRSSAWKWILVCRSLSLGGLNKSSARMVKICEGRYLVKRLHIN